MPSDGKLSREVSAGEMASLTTDLLHAVEEQGGTAEDIRHLLTPGGEPVLTQIARLVGAGREPSIAGPFPVEIDHDSVWPMIESWEHGDASSLIARRRHFFSTFDGREETDLFLAHFGFSVSSRDAEELMRKIGYQPEKGLGGLIAFALTHGMAHKGSPVVSLTSVNMAMGMREINFVPLLVITESGEMNFEMNRWTGTWNASCKFLVRRLE